MSVTVEHDGWTVQSNQTKADALASIGGGEPPKALPQGDGDSGAAPVEEPESIIEPASAKTGEEPAKTDEEPKPTSRPWKLLHQTEKQLKEAQRQAKEFQTRLEALEKPASVPAAPLASTPSPAARADAGIPVRPKLSNFPDWDSYEAAAEQYDTQLQAHLTRQFQQELETRQQREQQTRQASQFEQQVADQLNTVDGKGRSTYADWQSTLDAAQQAGPWDPRVTVAIATHPEAHHLAYALMKDPEEARRIAAVQHPVSFGVEMGQFIARVVAASSTGSAAPARTTAAHAPIKPVGSSVGAAETDPDDLPFGPEYVRRANARDAARRRR